MFAITHILYSSAFGMRPMRPAAGLVIGGISAVSYALLYPYLAGPFTYLVAVYIALIGFMGWRAMRGVRLRDDLGRGRGCRRAWARALHGVRPHHRRQQVLLPRAALTRAIHHGHVLRRADAHRPGPPSSARTPPPKRPGRGHERRGNHAQWGAVMGKIPLSMLPFVFSHGNRDQTPHPHPQAPICEEEKEEEEGVVRRRRRRRRRREEKARKQEGLLWRPCMKKLIPPD
ncbi:hypothetical protein CRUP_018380 [Coryphaenoides rupestris]|nr:hypothetical protein CRUP_018380 [Coryphaenoides rupestris]